MIGFGCFVSAPMAWWFVAQNFFACVAVCGVVCCVLAWHAHALCLCWRGACAPCPWLWLVVFGVGFMFVCPFVCQLYVKRLHLKQLCECSTHWVALTSSLSHSPDYVYGPPLRFARFISSCMIRGAQIYPRCRVLPTALRGA